MRHNFDFIGDCPKEVHNKITSTLNKLPKRKQSKINFSVLNTLAASVAAVLLLFVITWTINPVMAQGHTFRDALSKLFTTYPEAEELVEAPLPAPDINTAENEAVSQETSDSTASDESETAVLIESDESEAMVPSVVVGEYEFRLEDVIIYDGAQITVGYNVRKADGSTMPTLEEFTEDHLVGFIRIRDLMTGDKRLYSVGELIFDWQDPYLYRQIMTFDARDVADEVTNETEFVLTVGLYDYGEADVNDTVEQFAHLPFCVNTDHADYAKVYELEESTFEVDDFIVEVQPVIESATGMQVEIRGYKEDDPDFGKDINEYLFIRAKTMDGMPLGSAGGSFGYNIADDGSTYIESVFKFMPLEQLPDQFIIHFTCGDANTGEEVDYEEITVTFK